jgi:putative YhdH/YhfP family quinone oxidoreductase
MYRAVTVRLDSSKKLICEQVMLNKDNLPSGDLLIKVSYTSLNYNDTLLLSQPNSNMTYPLVPGTDASGVVVRSSVPDFKEGDEVLVTGCGLGTAINGGFGGFISVPADWAMPMPVGLTLKSSMILGSAGLAAGIGAMDFINSGITPDKNEVAITGASWDVGAVATALMSTLGYNVTAYISGGSDVKDYVTHLGATTVKSLASIASDSGNAMDTPIYDGVFDVMGGGVLSSLIKVMKPNGCVLVAGGAESMQLNTSLHPFIYRSINILGVDALQCSPKLKTTVWQMLSGEWKIRQLDWLCTEISLNELNDYIPLMLDKQIKGRVLVNHSL